MGIVTARVRLDPGTRHVLAWCAECSPWRVLTGSRKIAHMAAADHATRVHGDATEAAEHRRRADELR